MTIPKISEPERWPLDRTTNQPVQQPGEKTPDSQPSEPEPLRFTGLMQLTGQGICFAHGPYTNKSGYCPKWPACITDLQKPEYQAMRLAQVSSDKPTSAPQQETIHANDCGTKYGKSCTCEGVLEALVMPEEERFQPTYYVRHPDDSYSVAEPQPRLQKPKLFKGIKCIRCKRKIKQGGMSFPYCTALCKKFAEQEARGEEAHYVEP